MLNGRDLRFIGACVALFVIGAVALGIELWMMEHPADVPYVKGTGAGLVAGPGLMGIAVFEVVRRLRRGPEKPGRHTKL